MQIHKIQNFKGEFFKVLETTGKSQVGVMTIAPGGDSGPEEIHDNADQIVYAIEGEAEVEIDKEKAKLAAGELVIIPAGAQHHIYNHGTSPFFFLTIYAPPEY